MGKNFVKNAIVSNILFSGVEKLFLLGSQFLATILLVRLLPRQDYGVIGIVAGYFAFINIINISLESIILRDHQIYDQRIEKHIYNFFLFNILKSILFLLIAIILSSFLLRKFSNYDFVYSIFTITLIYISDALVAPLIIYQSAKFKQKQVTRISIFRCSLNVLLLFGLFYYPTLQYVFIKDLIVSCIYIITWLLYSLRFINLKDINFIEDTDLIFIKESLFSYSLWTHLNGVVTNIIYRSDTFFLSLFVGLVTVGNYSIALNSANIANILPMILGYQNSVALSYTIDDKQASNISNSFIRVSTYLGVVTFAGFYFLGDFYLYLITGEMDTREIYIYMMYIVGALVVAKIFANPLNAYINIKGSVKSLFVNVLLVLGIFAAIIYYFSAKYFGAMGIAKSNVAISILWISLMIMEIRKYNYDFGNLLCIKNDFVVLQATFLQFWNNRISVNAKRSKPRSK